MRLIRRFALLLFVLAAAGPARAQSLWPAAGLPVLLKPVAAKPIMPVAATGFPSTNQGAPGQQCRRAIRAAEQAAAIPNQLMAAIARVESGRREPDGSVNPWPWSINAEGADHIFDTKAEAVAAVRALQQQGVRSIDTGCMQVNLLHHPDAFASLEDAFDPAINAAYAARFLVQLRAQTGDWPTAAAWYHSATPDLGAEYARKVMAVWPEEQAHGGPAAPLRAWGGVAPSGAAAQAVPARSTVAKLLPLAAGAAGRGLAAYRSAPIPLAARPLNRLTLPAAPAG